MIKAIKGSWTKREPFSIAIVVSVFNEAVTQKLQQGAIERLQELGFGQKHITLIEVPGAVEIPLVAKRLAIAGKVEIIIVLGAVIRGETSHYDYVCEQVSQGCQKVSLDYNIPIIFGVLTTENEEQAFARVGGEHGHKGIEAVDCALAMHEVLKQIK